MGFATLAVARLEFFASSQNQHASVAAGLEAHVSPLKIIWPIAA